MSNQRNTGWEDYPAQASHFPDKKTAPFSACWSLKSPVELKLMDWGNLPPGVSTLFVFVEMV